MEQGRVLRPRGKGAGSRENSTTTTTASTTTTTSAPRIPTTTTTTTTNAAPPTTNTIPTLRSLAFPQIPVNGIERGSQPNMNNTITSPQYSSVTAQEIRQQFNANQNNISLNQDLRNGDETIVNNEGLTLRDYVAASVGASQAAVLGQVSEVMQQIVPRIVREVIRAERNTNFNPVNDAQNRPPLREEHRNQYLPRPPDYGDLNQSQMFAPDYGEYIQSQMFSTPNFYHNNRINTPLYLQKWGLKFDGSRKSFTVEDFVFRVESLQIDYNCPMTTLMKGFHHLLSGEAYEWFWTFRRENPYCEWPQLKYHIIRKFRRFENDSEIQRCIMERRQNSTESSENFIGEIIALKNQLKRSINEEELVRIVKDNLKDGIYQLIYPIPIRTFDQLLDECRRAERNISKRSNQRQYTHRRVNEVEFTEDDIMDIETLKVKPQPSKQFTCWNCKIPGHSFIECNSEKRNLFCYKCGFDDVITPKCPRCTGNK